MHTRATVRYSTLLMAVLLLLITASRLLRLPVLEMDSQEIRTIWQTFATPGQIIRATPSDWSALFYLMLGPWKSLIGIHPATIRILTVFIFVIGCTVLYRAARRIFGEVAAWLAVVAYSALGYTIQISTKLNAYTLLLALMPLALWFTIRYFDRSSLWRGILLAFSLLAMLYTYPTSVFAIAMLGLYTLIVYRRKVWLWWLPGIITLVLAIPEAFIINNEIKNQTLVPRPLLEFTPTMLQSYTGAVAVAWLVLLMICTVVIFYRQRNRQTLALALWLLIPIPLSLIVTIYEPVQQMWWVMTAIALWIGGALALLPRRFAFSFSALLVVAMFLPLPKSYDRPTTALLANFTWLTQHFQAGDAVLIDPNCTTASPEAWDYYEQVYFPHGLNIVTIPEGYRRIWYITHDGQQDPLIQQQVHQGRVAEDFVGPSNFLFRLYEGPPDPEGILFENGLRFRGVDVIDSPTGDAPPVRREGEKLKLRLWWSVDKPNLEGYSASVQLLNTDNTLLTQLDSEPHIMDLSTTPPSKISLSQWVPGQLYYEDQELTLPYPFPSGEYPIYMTVYQSQSNTRIAAPGVNADKLLLLEKLTIKSWHNKDKPQPVVSG
ncbi:MAG: glycosyltransferase family 39 protein [Chloroflexota bacterium]